MTGNGGYSAVFLMGIHQGIEVEIRQDIAIQEKKGLRKPRASDEVERADRPQSLFFMDIADADIPLTAVPAHALNQMGQIARGNDEFIDAVAAQPLAQDLNNGQFPERDEGLGDDESKRPQARPQSSCLQYCLHISSFVMCCRLASGYGPNLSP